MTTPSLCIRSIISRIETFNKYIACNNEEILFLRHFELIIGYIGEVCARTDENFAKAVKFSETTDEVDTIVDQQDASISGNSCTSAIANLEDARNNKDIAHNARVLAESLRGIFDGTVAESSDEKLAYINNLIHVCTSLKY